MNQMSLLDISQVLREWCLVPPEMENSQEFTDFSDEIEKGSLTAVKWAEGKHIKRKVCGTAGIDKGEGVQTLCQDGETFSSHWRCVFKVCTFYT